MIEPIRMREPHPVIEPGEQMETLGVERAKIIERTTIAERAKDIERAKGIERAL